MSKLSWDVWVSRAQKHSANRETEDTSAEEQKNQGRNNEKEIVFEDMGYK